MIVLIRHNHSGKHRWYYGRYNALDDNSGKMLEVKESESVVFANHFQVVKNSSAFIVNVEYFVDKEDCEILN